MNPKLIPLKEKIVSLLGGNLVSMILFGSQSRGDARPDSDVDLIVIVKQKTKEIIQLMGNIENSLMDVSVNWMDKTFSKFLNNIGFKKNIFLFSVSDWHKKKFAPFCKHNILSRLLLPKGIIWQGIKEDGKVLHGKNLLNYETEISMWDKIKAPLPGVFACLAALFIFIFAHDKAIALAQTGVKWTYMNVMGIVRRSELRSVIGNLIQVFKISFSKA